MRIGLLQCGHFPQPAYHPKTNYTDLYSRLLEGHGFAFQTWSVVDMEFPGSVNDADGWLLSGSKHGAYDDIPFIAPLESFIQRVYAAQLPMVGICFGHQIIAQALGGKVTKRATGWNCGRNDYAFEGTTKNLMAWHQDEVVSAPPEAVLIGSSKECAIAMIRYKGNALTMQPHPEFDDAAVRIVMDGPGGRSLAQAELDEAGAGLGTPDDSASAASDIAQFFKAAGDNG
ncbi:MAG: type 1 glutamine amidotransferase [Paracoccaceae bacterium]